MPGRSRSGHLRTLAGRPPTDAAPSAKHPARGDNSPPTDAAPSAKHPARGDGSPPTDDSQSANEKVAARPAKQRRPAGRGKTAGAPEALASPTAIDPGGERKWRRRKDARPGEILAAGLNCFAEKGFAATRLEEVAARAGVSKGTLYLYFPSKEDLFKAVVRETLLPNLVQAEQMARQMQGSALQALMLFLRRVAHVIGETKLVAIPKLVIAEAGNFPDLAKFYHDEVVSRGLALVSGLVRRGMESGEFKQGDPDDVARIIMAPMLLLAVWRSTFEPIGARPMNPTAYLATHLAVLLYGIAAEPFDPEELQP